LITIYAYTRAETAATAHAPAEPVPSATSIAAEGAAQATATAAAAVSAGKGRFRKDVTIEELPALLERTDTYLWVDMLDPTDEETELLSSVFHFHPLAIEDCIFEHPYPKIDEYADYLYLVLHGMRPPLEEPAPDARPEAKPVLDDELVLKTRELDIFLGQRYLLTFHYEEMRSIKQTRMLLEKNPEHIARGPAFLLHHVLDYLVDHYLPVMEALDSRIDMLEKELTGPRAEEVITKVFVLRQQVSMIRRLASRQREVLARISRQEFALIDHATALYFRDIYDHLARVADQAESYRELLSSLVEIGLARTSNRLNTIMKTLTLVNTIFLPLTFVTGIYGMNFDALPGKGNPAGFWLTVGGMAVGAATMLFFYRKKGWW